MTYLIIFLLVAGAGIGALWLYQKRQRVRYESVDGFRESLLRISSHPIAVPGSSAPEPQAPSRPVVDSRRAVPMDPARREAARRRLEARRAIRTP